jgi:hypothetical protein
MDAASKKALIDALEVSFASVGVELYSGAQRLKLRIDKSYPCIEASQCRDSLERYFDDCSDADEEEVRTVAAFFLAAPALLEQFVQASVKRAADDIPNPSGRPEALTPELKRQIVEMIYRLNRKKVLIGDAQSQAALKFGISKRTVQQVWRRRDEFEQQPFQSMDDIWKFIFQSAQAVNG